MAAPGFGFSVGDFIAGVQLLIQVTNALKASSRAQAEFQALIIELESLRLFLQRLQTLQPSNNSLSSFSPTQTSNCSSEVERFLEQVRKFETTFSSLSTGGETNASLRFRQIRDKVIWALSTKDQVVTLRATMVSQLTALNLYCEIEAWESRKRAESCQNATWQSVVALHERLDVLFEPGGQQVRGRVSGYVDCEEDAVSGAEREEYGATPGSGGGAVLGNAGEGGYKDNSSAIIERKYSGGLVKDPDFEVLRQQLHELLFMVWHFGRTLFKVMSALPAIPNYPSWCLDDNIILIDALNRKLSLPYAHFQHWPVVEARLRCAFENSPGNLKIIRGNYAIYSYNSQFSEQYHQENWMDLKPGQRLIMTFYMRSKKKSIKQCPRCGAKFSEDVEMSWWECQACGLTHRNFTNGRALPATPAPRLALETQANNRTEENSQIGTMSHREDTSTLGQRSDNLDLYMRGDDMEIQLDEEDLEIEHFAYVHWSYYRCGLCEDKNYAQYGRLVDHMQSVHQVFSLKMG